MSGWIALNYHGIESHAGEYAWEPGEKKYVVGAAQFAEQIRWVEKSGVKILSPSDISREIVLATKEMGLLYTFDDGHRSHYENARHLLGLSNIKALFFVTASFIGKPNYMNASQLIRLIKDGHEIGVHGFSHEPLTKMNAAELEREIVESRRLIRTETGVNPRFFSIPKGYANERIYRDILAVGYDGVFTSDYGINPDNVLLQRYKRLVITSETSTEEFDNLLRGQLGTKEIRENAKAFIRGLLPASAYELLSKVKRGVS